MLYLYAKFVETSHSASKINTGPLNSTRVKSVWKKHTLKENERGKGTMTDKKDKIEVLEPVKGSVEARPEDSFLTIFQVSVEKGYEPAFIEKMMELQERNDKNNAKKAYHEAMAAFKMNPPDIEKDQTVSYTVAGKGTTTYNHASLANVTGKINKALSEYGLSAAWTTSQGEGGITVTCTITHKLGHSESTSLTAGPDTSGGKNSIQAVGSTLSYLERYTILALTGLATHEMDDDGSGTEVEYITEDQVKLLQDERALRKADGIKFLAHMKVKTIEEIPAARFKEAMQVMKAKPIPSKDREPGEDG